MPNLLESDYPSYTVSDWLRKTGSSSSVALCLMLYTATFVVVQMLLGMKGAKVPQFYDCQKKAWIILVHIIGVYCYNSPHAATTVILWFCTLAYCGTLVLCILGEELRVRFFKFAMIAALGLTLLNGLIHWATRVSYNPKNIGAWKFALE